MAMSWLCIGRGREKFSFRCAGGHIVVGSESTILAWVPGGRGEWWCERPLLGRRQFGLWF